ncbi:MAG: hypothetical protein K2I30_06295, partial [Clostridia bacterium]|nr:hypothetical protein [Clostridia bacterium]
SEIKAEETIREVKKLCGSPRLSKSSAWFKYENCFGSGFLCDCAYGGNRYRCVYTKKYIDRDEAYFYKISGYPKGKIYVFGYEPIIWRVLKIEGGKALLLSEKAIDGQNFYRSEDRRIIDGKPVYPNNYEHSDIRQWLNGTFLNSAFIDDEKSRLFLTTVKNGAETTKRQPNEHACADTEDKVFLLSFREAEAWFTDNKARWKKATEYAKATGCYAYGTHDAKFSNCCWWLRSPDHKYYNMVRCVGDGGGLGDGGFSVSNEPVLSPEGIVPAIFVNLD